MRRSPFVITSTLIGGIALMTFRSSSVAPLNLNSLQSGSSDTNGASAGVAPKPVAKGSNSGSSASSSTSTSTSTPTLTPSPSTSTTTPLSTTTTTSPRSTSTTNPPSTTSTTTTTTTTTQVPTGSSSATGPVENYFYGTISVNVTVAAQKIVKVSIASLNDGGQFRSQQIDQIAIPPLEREAIAANSANIAGISGATYTSQGFTQSLQGALSTLGL